ncbi:hypothetical protein AURDEDRAFT_159166 [Auricularia subglabra TFB-10046 SS5]|nr:hypothetical protein AURDEDRAFT_159166 [Auricularia subglabra TFB-10046 SS5]
MAPSQDRNSACTPHSTRYALFNIRPQDASTSPARDELRVQRPAIVQLLVRGTAMPPAHIARQIAR